MSWEKIVDDFDSVRTHFAGIALEQALGRCDISESGISYEDMLLAYRRAEADFRKDIEVAIGFEIPEDQAINFGYIAWLEHHLVQIV